MEPTASGTTPYDTHAAEVDDDADDDGDDDDDDDDI